MVVDPTVPDSGWPRAVLVIHNPDAGDGAHPVSLLRRVLAGAGYRPRYVSTEMAWQAALADPADLVVVIGGDGTVGGAVRLLAGRESQVALLPTGTANNLAKMLGIAGDARDVVRAWREGSVVPLDVWQVEAGTHREPFVEAMGGGLLATVIANARDLEPPTFILGNEFDRALHLLRRASEAEPSRRWEIEIDGVDHSGEYIGVEVMNGPFVGPNVPLAPDATPGDGELDVVLLREDDRASLVRRFESLATAQAPAPSSLHIARGRAVHVTPPSGVALHLDGETWDPGGREGERLRIVSAGTVRMLVGRR